MRKIVLFLFFAVLLTATGCENTFSDECTDIGKNRQILSLMKNWYYWYDTIDPDISPYDYKTPQDLLNAIRYREGDTLIDHFSYVVTKKQHDDYYSGKYYGLGYGQKKDSEGNYFISMVYPDSPAGNAGLTRGMKIVTINGYTPQQMNENQEWNREHRDDENYDDIKKYDWSSMCDEQGKEVELVTVKDSDEPATFVMHCDETHVKSVLKSAVLTQNGQSIGYLAFKAFISPSPGELDAAFAEFDKQQVTQLIVDLRYNGGGLLSVAAHLAGLIDGKELSGKEFIRLDFNKKHLDNVEVFHFPSPGHALSVKKIAFIVTRSTASASEAVISGLKPYVDDIALIGATTYGKPVGMNPMDVCDLKLVPITFKVTNADGWGDYYYGMEPDCAAEDDFTHDFGDPEEASVKEALAWLATGRCSEKSEQVRVKTMSVSHEEPNAELPVFNRVIGTL